MADASQSLRSVTFGPFELNTATGELTKRGIRIRLAGQPLNVLLVLVARPGQVVSGDELRQKLWGDGTFVDFEHGLHAAMNKLRRTLGDSAENARYIETVPGMGYRFIGSVAEIPPHAPGKMAIAPQQSKRRNLKLWWSLAAAAACLLSFALGWRIHHSQTLSPGLWQLSQVTSDAGLSYTPAISGDGTLITYSSDRSSPGQLDLYVKQVSGENSLRLTFDGLGNTSPNFSPDGSKVVFRSDRDGGGVYEIPTFGGEVRLLAKEGRNPSFSPDGSKVAYWIGGEHVAASVPGNGTVWVTPVGSGHPWQVGANLTNARFPIWSPDGRGLLLLGYTSSKAYDRTAVDWWFVSIDGKQTIRTGIYGPLIRAGLHFWNIASGDPSSVNRPRDLPSPSCWSTSGTVIFSAQSGYTRNLWRTYISPQTGKAGGDFTRLTVGAANEWEPSCRQDDQIAFTSLQPKRNVWSVPFDLNGGKVKGPLQGLSKTLAVEEHAALSRDGRYVAFASARTGTHNIWLHEVASGKELRVAESALMERYPVISPSGGKLAYSVYSADGVRLIYTVTPGGAPEQVCRGGCLRATDWANDEKSLLVFGGSPYRVSRLDIASRNQAVLLAHDTYSLLYARYSPDNQWLSFTARVRPNHAKIMLAPVAGQSPVPESQWIQLAEGGPEDWANWSPDGRTLYFTSPRDGHFCFWGQRIDPVSHRPVGEPFPALHLHGTSRYEQGGWSAAGDRIAMVLSADSGNVWLLSRSPGR